MGVKTWMLVYSNANAKEILKSKPLLNREFSIELAKKLFPSKRFTPIEDGNLLMTNPPRDKVYIGSFPGMSVVSSDNVAIDYPSKLPQSFIDTGLGNTLYLFAMHSVVDWFAYAIWKNGTLIRSLSVSGADGKVLENIGPKQPFEELYWSEGHPLFDDPKEENDSPYNFNPLDLGNAALNEYLGYQLEGYSDTLHIDPEKIPLVGLQKLPWWKIW
ncbi:hypothetical protein PGH07_01800 [Sulfurovum sp. zt1-1]|uniref:Uncharacterized protein n=1 Tax=Sulfurovum zhangzhouensis TaxID=3019067 RepID=A0ABT7QVU4_9BACT|nr:hypothetical protein [Sulfurovum zhangzhouensis]MDM5270907.1 hypothetical protein [Sulfurovum zhangzhouensis]